MKEESVYPVEDDIAIPSKHVFDRYPFNKMNVGNSFRVKTGTVDRVRSAACQFSKRNPPTKFTIRVVDPVKKIYRCWRIA